MEPLQQKEVKQNWTGTDLRDLAISILLITILLSLFDIHPVFSVWLIDILRNFVVTSSIVMTIYTLSYFLQFNEKQAKWIFFLKSFFLFAIGGALGGLIAWGINDLLFGFNITHPALYLILTASLAVIFGFVINGFISVQLKLRQTSEKLAEQEMKEQKLVNLKTRAELEALRAKVNPHFFFNTLNSIASLIPENPVKAEEVVEKFSNLFRYSLETSDESLVSLDKEVEFICEYLEVEKVRLAERLNYTVDIDPELKDFKIPGMLLQPLVENSIRHGIAPSKKGGEIRISSSKEDGRCIILITDSGVGFKKESTEGFGLNGVKERLRLQYGSDFELEIKSSDGVSIRIDLPYSNENNV